MFSEKIEFFKRAIERATPQIRRPALIGTAVFICLGVLVILGLSNTSNPLGMPSTLGGIAVSQAVWGLKPSNLLMVLPIGSFLVVLARSFIGMKAFGLFTPMLIALAFLQIGPIFGPLVMIAAIGSGMIVAPSLLKLRMTRVGFLGVLISLVVFILSAMQNAFDTELQVDAFPVVVTALCCERWWRQWEKDGWYESAKLAGNTLMLALVIQFVMVSHVALMLMDVSPMLLPGFAAIAITILGRYRGLRMTEIGRFLPIWYEGWKRKLGQPMAEAIAHAEEDEVNEILAARKAIDIVELPEVVKKDEKVTLFPARPPVTGRSLVLTKLTPQVIAPEQFSSEVAPTVAAAQRPAVAPAPPVAPPPVPAPAPLVAPEAVPVAAPPPAPAPAAEPEPAMLPAFAKAMQLLDPHHLATTPVASAVPAPRPAIDWAQVRTELNMPNQGANDAQPAFASASSPGTAGKPVAGGLSAFFTGSGGLGRLVDPAALGFLYPAGRHPGDQPAQRDHRQVQSAARDRTGARQGGGQGGAGGARGRDLGHDSRHLRLWSA